MTHDDANTAPQTTGCQHGDDTGEVVQHHPHTQAACGPDSAAKEYAHRTGSPGEHGRQATQARQNLACKANQARQAQTNTPIV